MNLGILMVLARDVNLDYPLGVASLHPVWLEVRGATIYCSMPANSDRLSLFLI
jgi:hypothetical protein